MSTAIPKETTIVHTPDAYLHALPSQSDTIDLATADSTENRVAAQLIDRLMTLGSFDFKISASQAAADKLKHIFSETTFRHAQTGCKTIAVGYPLAIFHNGQHFSTPIAMPVLLWYCDIAPSHIEVSDFWRISRQPETLIEPNWHLIAVCRDLYQVDLEPAFTQILQKKPILWADLSDLCDMVCRLMLVSPARPATGIEPCPTLASLEKGDAFATVSWSGVIGDFPFQQAEVPLRTIENIFSPNTHHAYLPRLHDAFQQTAFQSVLKKGVTVAEGNAATGKSFLVSNTVCNFLSNKKRTLIVAPNTAALNSVHHFLKDLGLSELAITAVNPQETQQMLFEKLCRISEKNDTLGLFNETQFKRQIFENQQITQDKNNVFDRYTNKILGEKSQADLVSGYVQSHQQVKKSLLNTHLKINDFEQNWQEWQQLQTAVQQAQHAFAPIGTLRHPLLKLTTFVFNEMPAPEGEAFLKQQLEEFIATAQSLHQQYLEKTDTYVETIIANYTQKSNTLHAGIAKVHHQLQLGKHLYGDDFGKQNSLHLLKIFSDKQRNIRQGRDEVQEVFKQLKAKFEENNLFHFKFSDETADMKAMSFELHAFERALHDWEQLIPKLVTQQLHTSTIIKETQKMLKVSEDLSSLAVECSLFVKKLNKSNLFRAGFKSEHYNPTLKITDLERIIDVLREIQHNVRDFEVVKNWHSIRKPFNNLQLSVIDALVRVQPSNWESALSGWYFSHILAKNNVTSSNHNQLWQEYHETHHHFQAKIIHQIYAFWTMRQKEVARQYLQKNRGEWIALKNGRKMAASAQDFAGLALNLAAISDIFPIVLTTPQALNHILQQKNDLQFDLVCFDNADAISIQDAATAWNMGNKILITGNADFNHAPRRFTSLFSYAKYNYSPTIELKTLHGFDKNDRLVFCKQAFGWAATPPPAAATPPYSNATKIFPVGGYFSDGVNRDEIAEILKKIVEIETDITQNTQSIAIVCFTKAQRNALQFELSARTLYENEAQKAMKTPVSVSVLYLSECGGQQFDVLMVSTAMGTVDVKGTLTNHTQLLNLPESKVFLQQLLSRPVRLTYWFHSIPKVYLDKWATNEAEGGKFLLANFINYSDASVSQQEKILANLSKRHATQAEYLPIDGLLKVILEAIKNDLQKDQHIDYQVIINNHYFSAVIQSEGKTFIPVLDGSFAGAENGNSEWNFAQVKQLQEQGWRVLLLWSEEWYRDFEGAKMKLLTTLKK
jgi:hypothetical protein